MRLEVSSNVEQEDNAFLGQRVKFPASVDAPCVAPWNSSQHNIREAESADDDLRYIDDRMTLASTYTVEEPDESRRIYEGLLVIYGEQP